MALRFLSKKMVWAVGLAFLAACKNLVWFSEGSFSQAQIDAEIAALKSQNLSADQQARLMAGAKNAFLDSVKAELETPVFLIQNASFEELHYEKITGPMGAYFFSKSAKNWMNVAPHAEESPFDLQPGQFEVERKAAHGDHFVGMVGRDNETNESMGQVLSKPLEAGKFYEWSLFACRSEKYESRSRTTNKPASFCEPMILRIWGGKKAGRAEQLFAQTGPIENTGWQKICFVLKPNEPCEALFIEAAHSDLVSKTAYNGNVLIDAVGPVREIGPTKN